MGMAKGYRRVDRDQVFLLPADMREWLPEDHLVWFLIAAVERMDTSAFHTRARLGGVGRRGYDPDMLLTLFVYAMAQGESSSRRIERLCHTDVAFRLICAQDVPDHTVLARFRQRHERALAGLLTESLVLAAELGMVSLGVVALDGTRIAANASKDANRTEEGLRRLAEGYLAGVAATDAKEDGLFGADQRGDELPEPMRDRSDRGGRIQRALDEIEARRGRAEAERGKAEARARQYEQAAAGGRFRAGQAPKGVDPVPVARARWEREHAKATARYEQYRQARVSGAPRTGRPPLPADEVAKVKAAWAAYQRALAAAAEPADPVQDDAGPRGGCGPQLRANLTDPDSRLLKTRNGWVQGLNCQTSTSDDVFILTARATQDANDVGQFIPTKEQLEATMAVVAVRTGRQDLTRIGTMIADAGYDSLENLAAEGPDRLIADSKSYQIQARAVADPAAGAAPEQASLRERMNHRLRTPEGLALYRRRAHMIEAPNAWLKDGRGLRRFSRRGLLAAQSELSLGAAVTNLLRLAGKGVTTAQLQVA